MDDDFYNLFVKAQTLDDRRKMLLLQGMQEVLAFEESMKRKSTKSSKRKKEDQ